MMHKPWCSIGEVPYCFLRSSIKFQGHAGQNIANFVLNWAFLDCISNFISPMDFVFQGHPSNFKVTRAKKSMLNPIWGTLLGRLQLSNPSDLPCCQIDLLSWTGGCLESYGVCVFMRQLQVASPHLYEKIIFDLESCAIAQMKGLVILSIYFMNKCRLLNKCLK